MGLPSCGQHGLAVKHDEPTREEEEEEEEGGGGERKEEGMITF